MKQWRPWNIEINSFRTREPQLLRYVRTPEVRNLNKLPEPEALCRIYTKDEMIPCIDPILLDYQKKIDILPK